MTDPDEPLPLPPSIGRRYLPIRCLARGGMGTVYEVKHAVTGDHWALKVLHGPRATERRTLERFRREAQVSARVKGDHVVRVIDADVAPELEDAFFIVMDLLEGKDLADLAGTTPQAPAHVVGWLAQAARGLAKAHAAGVVHRDLKPANLFLAKTEQGPVLKVVDFGIAKVRESESTTRTASGTVVGTPLYMAPEQAAGDAERIGPATDIWSVGIIAFRLLHGGEYWDGANISAILGQIAYAPMAPPSERGLVLGPAFDAWFARSCARDPGARFASAEEQARALADALEVPFPLPHAPAPAFAGLDGPPGNRDLPLAAPAQSIEGTAAERRGTDRAPRAARPILSWLAAAGVVAVLAALAVTRSSSPGAPPVAAPPPASKAATAPPTEAPPAPPVAESASPPPVPAASAVPSARVKPPPTPAAVPSAAKAKPAGSRRDPLADPD